MPGGGQPLPDSWDKPLGGAYLPPRPDLPPDLFRLSGPGQSPQVGPVIVGESFFPGSGQGVTTVVTDLGDGFSTTTVILTNPDGTILSTFTSPPGRGATAPISSRIIESTEPWTQGDMVTGAFENAGGGPVVGGKPAPPGTWPTRGGERPITGPKPVPEPPLPPVTEPLPVEPIVTLGGDWAWAGEFALWYGGGVIIDYSAGAFVEGVTAWVNNWGSDPPPFDDDLTFSSGGLAPAPRPLSTIIGDNFLPPAQPNAFPSYGFNPWTDKPPEPTGPTLWDVLFPPPPASAPKPLPDPPGAVVVPLNDDWVGATSSSSGQLSGAVYAKG